MGRRVLIAGILLWTCLVAGVGEVSHAHLVLITCLWGLCPGLSRSPDPANGTLLFYVGGIVVGSSLLLTLGLALIKNENGAAWAFLAILYMSTVASFYRWHIVQV